MPDHSLIPKRDEYYVQTGSMFENPYGVPHDEIVAMLLEMPAEVAAQVIFGKYVESSGLVFTGELIQMMIDRSLPRVTSDYWYDKQAVAEARSMNWERRKLSFATGVDFARETDYTVISTLDVRTRPARLVYYKRLNRVPWESIYREVGRAAAIFGQSVLGDSTGMGGDVIFDSLENRRYCVKHDQNHLIQDGECRDLQTGITHRDCTEDDYISLSCVDGYEFTTRTKVSLIEHQRNVMSVGYIQGSELPFGWIRIPPIVQVEEEFSFYFWADKGLETDGLMSLCLASWQGLEDVPQASAMGSPHGD